MGEMRCHKLVEVKGGSCLAATDECSLKVRFVDHEGRFWCKRHSMRNGERRPGLTEIKDGKLD